MWQIFMENNSKGEFNVLVKDLELSDHEFLFSWLWWHLELGGFRCIEKQLVLGKGYVPLYVTLLLVIQEVG